MTTVDGSEQEPAVLTCGCPEQVVRDEGHQEGCRFEGKGPQDYPWIVEYCGYIGVVPRITEELVNQARREEAPLDAFWFWLRKGEEHWMTVAEMSALSRARLGLPSQSETEG